MFLNPKDINSISTVTVAHSTNSPYPSSSYYLPVYCYFLYAIFKLSCSPEKSKTYKKKFVVLADVLKHEDGSLKTERQEYVSLYNMLVNAIPYSTFFIFII